jgi:hypothetical protein
MTGLDSAVAALLASRTDMLLSALNTQTSSTAPQANTSQLLIDTPRVATPAAAEARNDVERASDLAECGLRGRARRGIGADSGSGRGDPRGID